MNLWGASPLTVNPVNVFKSLSQILAEGKGGTARDRLEEASGNAMSRRTETAYKAQSPCKSAQHDEAPDSGDRVNTAVVWRQFTSLSGEICPTCDEIRSAKDPGMDHREIKVQAHPDAIAGCERTIDSTTQATFSHSALQGNLPR